MFLTLIAVSFLVVAIPVALAVQLLARKGDARFHAIADASPVAIWIADAEGSFTYVNDRWVLLTGRSADREMGDGWLQGVHPDDRRACETTYRQAFLNQRPFSMEYRTASSTDRPVWVLNEGTPRFRHDGVFDGFAGGCIDVTERRANEQTLRELGRRLVAAQEEERQRIARDLHDNLNQRVALLSMDIEHLAMKPPAAESFLRKKLMDLHEKTAEIASEIHNLSHELHSTKLEVLGLVAGIRGLCQEFAAEDLHATFADSNVPDALPPDLALCLFRVAQEALNNVSKHSGSTEAHVTLFGEPDAIVLRVTDEGRGFDVAGARESGRLGLVYMRERLRAIGGELAIYSARDIGTTVEARVPLLPAAGRPAAEANVVYR
jgi:PAS domain S-box-containing protein